MKRILFVDDEPDMLNGLKRMLRARRGTWTMVFVASAEEALSAMSVDPFDVVVTDMKMPGMNGVELLEHIRAHHPRTGRLVLSGQIDTDAYGRSVSVSHHVLTKPCDRETLRRTIDRMCGPHTLLAETVEIDEQ